MSQHFYFSESLIKKMDEIVHYPLTVLRAGSGYGKTTAVKELFFKRQAAGYRQLIYTCFGESASASWRGICLELERIDPQTGQYLASFQTPSEEVLGDIAHQMNYLTCACDTILCIDNFQLFAMDAKDKLIDALSLHRCDNLHIIIITQPLKLETQRFSAYQISADDFTLNKEEIKSYFKQCGQPLNDANLEYLAAVTGGYMAALRLQMNSLMQTGRLESSAAMSTLMEHVLWKHLLPEEQKCLICLSLLQSFSLREGAAVCGWMPEVLASFLKQNDFITFDMTLGKYVFHHLLLIFLTEIFNNLNTSAQVYFWKLAAEAEKAEGNSSEAALFFAKCNDFKSVLQLSFESSNRIELIRMENGMIVQKLIQPEYRKHLKMNPELILTLTLELFVQGKMILFQQYLEQVKWLLSMADEYPAERKNRLLGEYALMESFFHFNNIEQMCICHQRAYQLLKGPTRLYSLNTAWTFGIPSVVCMFWREPGKLRTELSQLTEGLPVYHKLSCGNGLGASQAMAAEMALLSGDDKAAEEHFKEAMFEAERLNQDSICFCSCLGLAKIAVFNGNTAAYIHMQEKIEDLAYLGKESRNVFTADVCKGYLYLMLGQYAEIPEWLGRKEGIRSRSLAIGLPFAQLIYGGMLLKQAKTHQISHVLFMEETENLILESRQFNMLLPQVYYHIYQAIEANWRGERREAAACLKSAMKLAEADKVYFPFAEFYRHIQVILESLVLRDKLKYFRETVSGLGLKFQKGRSTILDAMNVKKVRLTPRELEIAGLLKERYSVKEIAARLSISPSTVSNTMQSIYAKLGIHSKRELYPRTDI